MAYDTYQHVASFLAKYGLFHPLTGKFAQKMHQIKEEKNELIRPDLTMSPNAAKRSVRNDLLEAHSFRFCS